MSLGEPSPRQQALFAIVQEAQAPALESIRTGIRCSTVETQVRSFLVARGREVFLKHYTGHGLGLEIHEAPFLDLGDETMLQAGIVLVVEPGLYAPGLGGLCHSDTVIVREGGVEILADYPRTIDALTIEP